MAHIHYTLTAKVREQSIELLNSHLAATIDLHAQLKVALWNVRGIGFMSIHRLLDKVATSVLAFEDIIAERISGLGGVARGTIQHASQATFLLPYQVEIASETQHAFAISSSLAAFSQSVTSAIAKSTNVQDYTTVDLFSQILRSTDAALWRVSNHVDVNVAPTSQMAQASKNQGNGKVAKSKTNKNSKKEMEYSNEKNIL